MNISFFQVFFQEFIQFHLFNRCQIVVFERFWNKSVFQFNLVVQNSFFWKSICFLFVENIQEFVVIFFWYLVFQWNIFLLLIMSLMKKLRSSCFLLGDAPRPPIFPPIFLRHLCIFLPIVASPRRSALAAPIPESDDHMM